MKVPARASKVTVWSVWDSRRVRQGAHLMADGLTYAAALKFAVELAAKGAT